MGCETVYSGKLVLTLKVDAAFWHSHIKLHDLTTQKTKYESSPPGEPQISSAVSVQTVLLHSSSLDSVNMCDTV
jgi:hypothetical protein